MRTDATNSRPPGGRTIRIAIAVFAVVFLIYNANGREIASYDSQPTKLAAIEFARYHHLKLDRPVALAPDLAKRPGFVRDRDNHYRSAYPVLPSLVAGLVASILGSLRLVDLRAPLAAGLIAKLTASLMVSIAVACAYAVARRRVATRAALLVAAGFGLGTNLWALASQTLWQTETATAALSGVLLCLAVPSEKLAAWRLWLGALLLGCAGAARPQLAPAIAIIALSVTVRRGRIADALALLPLVTVGLAVVAFNLHWFAHPLGAVPRLEALHPAVHGVDSAFGNPIGGIAGLLFSPSRGLLVFSPVVLVALLGLPAAYREGWRGDLRWWATAATVQLAFYACYSVWWAGHTYGPRYAIDILPLLVPLAAAALSRLRGRSFRQAAAAAALAWSIAVAATGAFIYPYEQWNSDPVDVDRNHERLWDWRDPQMMRCWKAGPSPDNFRLFSARSVRREGVRPRP